MVIPSKIDVHMDVLVIGAGVSGLTTAICLAEAGLAVRLLARKRPADTTSAVAGASWGPYPSEDPRVSGWSAATHAVLASIADGDRPCGIRLVHGMEAQEEMTDPPAWATVLPSFRPAAPSELPAHFRSGWWFTSPLVDMPTYLSYLEHRLSMAGTGIEVATVDSLEDVAGLARVVVNCTGLAARNLVGDPDVKPTRGQLVVVKNPGVEWFFQDSVEIGDMTYFLPHGDHVVLGGSAIPGAEHLEFDPDIAKAIIARCAAVEPLLRDPVVLGHRVGLRPMRTRVRLELDDRGVVHNYGHGGSGVTLSWGCAHDVLALVQAHLGQP